MSATLPSVEDMLARLVALPSVSSVSPALDTGNRGVSELLAQWLEDLGLEVTLSDVPGQPSKCNLMATLGEGDGGLALAGHTDTVPFDADRWQSDPFRISRRDDRLYGLGTTDMKGFFAVLLDALAGFPLARLRAPLTVLATADEESGMAGARALARDGRAPARQVLIGEPTALRPVRAHKGIFMLRIVLSGRSGHSSDPALGVSALEGMTAALAALGRLRQELAERWRDERFNVPYPTLNVGRVAGGDNPNRICARCELDMDLRTVPGLGLAAARDLVTTAVTSALSGSGIEVRFESLFDGVEALDTPADAAIVRCCEALSGQQAGCVSFATEAPIYAALGMEAVIMGPGDITVAHQPDEYLALSRIEPMRRAIRQLASDLCL